MKRFSTTSTGSGTGWPGVLNQLSIAALSAAVALEDVREVWARALLLFFSEEVLDV